MNDDRPRAATRHLLNLTARLLAEHDLSGHTPREVALAVVAACSPGARRVAPVRPDPEYEWVDGCWMPLGGHETDAETDMTREDMHVNIKEMNSSKYLTADGIEGKSLTLTIDAIRREKMSDGKDKWVMYFREITEGWVLNKTGINTLGEYFGDETDDWERQKITLVAEMVPFGEKKVLGIRPYLPQTRPRPAAARPVGKPARPVTQEEADLPDDGWEPGRE